MKTDVACARVLLTKRHLSSRGEMRNTPVICSCCKQWFREKLWAPGQIWGSCHTGHLDVCFAAVVQGKSSHSLAWHTAGSYHTRTRTCLKYLTYRRFRGTSKSCETDTSSADCALALNSFYWERSLFLSELIRFILKKEGRKGGVTQGKDEQL